MGLDGTSGKPSHPVEFLKNEFLKNVEIATKGQASTDKLNQAAERALSHTGFSKDFANAAFLGNLKVTIVYSHAMPEARHAGCVPENFIRLNPEAMEQLLAEHHVPENSSGPEGGNSSSLWVRMPSTPGGHEILGTAIRNLFPNGSLSQDGLRSFLASPGFQTLFSGGQIIPGGTLSLPPGQLASVLMSFAVSIQNPEMAMAVFITQTLLPDLLAGNITQGALHTVLQELIQADPSLGVNPHEILNSLGQLFSFSGMTSLGEVENLMKALVETHSQNLLQEKDGASLEKFNQWVQNTALSNLPQTQGLDGLLQGNLQNLNQFSGVLRMVMGMLILNPQNQWPRTVPNEQFLSELGKLFAAQYEKRERKKEKKTAPKKKGGRPEEQLKENHEHFEGLLGRNGPYPNPTV